MRNYFCKDNKKIKLGRHANHHWFIGPEPGYICAELQQPLVTKYFYLKISKILKSLHSKKVGLYEGLSLPSPSE